MSHRDEMNKILAEVKDWPKEERVELAHHLLGPLPFETLARLQLVAELAGAIKTDGPPPTDEEVKQSYSDYLVKKYN